MTNPISCGNCNQNEIFYILQFVYIDDFSEGLLQTRRIRFKDPSEFEYITEYESDIDFNDEDDVSTFFRDRNLNIQMWSSPGMQEHYVDVDSSLIKFEELKNKNI